MCCFFFRMQALLKQFYGPALSRAVPETNAAPLMWRYILHLWEENASYDLGKTQSIAIPSWNRTTDLILYHTKRFFQLCLSVQNIRSVQCFIVSEIFVINQLTLGSMVTGGEGWGCSRTPVPAKLPAVESPLLLEVATGPGQSDFRFSFLFFKSQW